MDSRVTDLFEAFTKAGPKMMDKMIMVKEVVDDVAQSSKDNILGKLGELLGVMRIMSIFSSNHVHYNDCDCCDVKHRAVIASLKEGSYDPGGKIPDDMTVNDLKQWTVAYLKFMEEALLMEDGANVKTLDENLLWISFIISNEELPVPPEGEGVEIDVIKFGKMCFTDSKEYITGLRNMWQGLSTTEQVDALVWIDGIIEDK